MEKKPRKDKYCQRDCCGYFHVYRNDCTDGCPNAFSNDKQFQKTLLESVSGEHGSEVRKAARDFMFNRLK